MQRKHKFLLVLSPAEKASLDLLAERVGGSRAAVVRGLLYRACEEVGVPVSFQRAGVGVPAGQ